MTAAELVARFADEQPDLVRLAEVLSLAAHVEPPLLRRARLAAVPAAGPELEGRFWFSPLVESAGVDHLLVDAGAADVLRERLRARPADLAAARDLVRAAHEHADPAVVLFEQVVALSLEPGADAGRVAEHLLRLATTMAEDRARAPDVARWVLRHVPRLPGAVRGTSSAVAVRLLAADQLGVHVVVPEVTAEAAELVEALTPGPVERVEVIGVRLTTDGVELSHPPRGSVERIELPGAHGRIVRVSAPGGGPARHVQVPSDGSVHVDFSRLALVGTAGAVLRSLVFPGRVVALLTDDRLERADLVFADGVVRRGSITMDPADWEVLPIGSWRATSGPVVPWDRPSARRGARPLADEFAVAWSRGSAELDFRPVSLVESAEDGRLLVAGTGGAVQISRATGGRAVVLTPELVASRRERAAGSASDWHREAVFYDLVVTSFQDSDRDGVGDLEGVKRRLGYLAWLGVDCVVLETVASYDVPAELPELVRAVHRAGLRVVLDLGGIAPSLVLRSYLDTGVDGLRLTRPAGYDSSAELMRCRAVVDDYPGRVLILHGDAPSRARAGADLVTNGDFPARLLLALAHGDCRPVAELLPTSSSGHEGVFLRDSRGLDLRSMPDADRMRLYQEYAQDPRMAGDGTIRRRLAPLLRNDHRLIRLCTALLLSLPGSPFLYYGDEIGMGDNIWLEDPDPVRTPMQWTPGGHAGFTAARARAAALPVVDDQVYGYRSVNVTAQQSTGSSLLSRIRDLIGVRKQFRLGGKRSLRPLRPPNQAILAFLLDGDGDPVLCVYNLSPVSQPVELDLRAYSGLLPVELFGGARFPRIGELFYELALGGHGFYWFRLTEPGDRR